jgi:hypothetical protein
VRHNAQTRCGDAAGRAEGNDSNPEKRKDKIPGFFVSPKFNMLLTTTKNPVSKAETGLETRLLVF